MDNKLMWHKELSVKSEAEKLEIIIRKQLPRLMEVQRDFIFVDHGKKYIVNDIDQDNTDDNISDGNKMVVYGLLNEKGNRDGVSNPRLEFIKALEGIGYKKIGKLVNFLDICEFIDKFVETSSTFETYIEFDGTIGILHKYTDGDIEGSESVTWDLSKPYLRDQSDEVIQFIFNLPVNF